MKKTFLLLLISVIAIFKTVISVAMTEPQLQNAAKLIRNVCQPKMKISDKMIDNLHKGEFVENEKLMCYLECVLRMGKLMKNGKFDLKFALAQIPTLPTERQQLTKDTIENCKDKGKEDDKCTAAFQVAKCFYLDNPKNYFLP